MDASLVHLVVFLAFSLVVLTDSTKERSQSQDDEATEHEGSLPKLYMSEHCQRWFSQYATNNYHVFVDTSAEVQLTRNPHSMYPMQCIVTFAARKPNQRLLLHFESMEINYNPGTIDRLRVFDGFQASLQSQLSSSHGLYGKYYKGVYEFSSGGIHDYKSTTSALTLFFEGSPSPAFTGFKAVLTVFTLPFSNGSCSDNGFKCSVMGICISDALVCSGSPNCGENDHSDTDACKLRQAGSFSGDSMLANSTDMGLMVGCAISIVILMVVILWFGIICLKRNRYYSSRQHECFNRPPVSVGPDEVEGTVVEPVQPRNFMAPILAFFEPPPLYSENSPGVCPRVAERPRFEPPPPYSVEDHDTAGLILNECSDSRLPVAAVNNAAVQVSHPRASQQTVQCSHIPVVIPAAGSAVPEAMDNANNEVRYQCLTGDKDTAETTPLAVLPVQPSGDEAGQISSQQVPLVVDCGTDTSEALHL